MRFLSGLVLVCTLFLSVSMASASTLDPSHPLWSRTDLDRTAWKAALREAALQHGAGPKLRARAVGRGDLAAVGLRVLVVPVLPADAGPAPRSRDELVEAWTGAGEGSVRGYWNFASAGQLDLEIRVLPWLKVPGTLRTDYLNVLDGNPVVNFTAGPRRLAGDALAAAAGTVLDLGEFDDDGPDGQPGSGDDDGVLDLVVVLHPFTGWEVETGSPDRAIASLQARLGREAIPGSALRGGAFVVASATDPLGVWVHEFGHLLGLPDLYDLDRSVLEGTPGDLGLQGGPGRWSLMASGTWGGEGTQPSGLDAWSRSRLGFGTTVGAEAGTVVELEWPGPDRATVLRVDPLGDWKQEYFLAEARRRRAGAVVDGDLPGEGVLVYRVRPDLAANRTGQQFLELLQADGNDDIGAGLNDGDATDPFDGNAGRDRLGPTTVPSSLSFQPDPERTPPLLVFSRGDSGIRLRTEFSEASALQLEQFQVEDPALEPRSWLRVGEAAELVLRFASVGEVAPVQPAVRLNVLAGARTVSVTPPDPVDLVLSDGSFTPRVPITLSDDGGLSESGVAELELEILESGSVVRRVRLGFPIDFQPGLSPADFAAFEPEVLAAVSDTTRFSRLLPSELPDAGLLGFGLETDGVRTYGNDVELTLSSPWFAVDGPAALSLWSRQSTEIGIPGQAFDGGVLEVLVPDRGWLPLDPEGVAPVWIPRQSTAPTHDRAGFGGEALPWSTYSAALPSATVPLRVRARFGSDGSVAGEGWWISDLGTSGTASAEISLDPDRGAFVLATATFSGDLSRVVRAQYRYRVNRGDAWRAASGFFSVAGAQNLTVELVSLPSDLIVGEIALFAGAGGPGDAGEFLLGVTGFRRAPGSRPITLLQNPSRGKLVLQLPSAPDPLDVGVYDLRGRRVAHFVIPANTAWFEWDPEADGGRGLASGQYFLRANFPGTGTVRFVWFR